jgi:hypothetical protein
MDFVIVEMEVCYDTAVSPASYVRATMRQIVRGGCVLEPGMIQLTGSVLRAREIQAAMHSRQEFTVTIKPKGDGRLRWRTGSEWRRDD